MVYTVKQARLISGRTQQDMADLLHVHRDTYRKIEERPDEATIKQAKKISEITGIPIDQIFFGQNSTFGRQSSQSSS
jgi:DNA-binding XRE family transcriptional regulator